MITAEIITAEILGDIITYIACVNGYGSEKAVSYYDFRDWTDIVFTIPEVANGYKWLVANGFIEEFMNDRHSDEKNYYNIRATAKAWAWAKKHNIEL